MEWLILAKKLNEFEGPPDLKKSSVYTVDHIPTNKLTSKPLRDRPVWTRSSAQENAKPAMTRNKDDNLPLF